jgi:hypothetical protein
VFACVHCEFPCDGDDEVRPEEELMNVVSGLSRPSTRVRPDRGTRALDSLLDNRTSGYGLEVAARILGLPMTGRFVVIARSAVRGGVVLPVVRDVRVLWRVLGELAVGVARLEATDVSALLHGLPTTPAHRTGVCLVEGVERLADGRKVAELAARTADEEHPVVSVDHCWTTAVLNTCPDVATELSVDVLAPVLALDHSERDLLLHTFTAWLTAGGSPHRAATALYCHRNTVQNRLRRLERLTRRSLTDPADLVEVVLAVQALRLSPVVRRSLC